MQLVLAPAYYMNMFVFPAPFMTSSGGGVQRPEYLLTSVAPDMATPSPVTPETPFEPSKPPVIEGFSPSIYSNPEGFKEKFLRKTRENPMVPIVLSPPQAAWARRPPSPMASTASIAAIASAHSS
ncbi:HIG1 hypoxia inducible domain family member 2A, transcript variant X2 [Ictidomys tridecemlineatus]|uniref:HIG1 domain family member 2A, mitochondrial isoform X2 n=1 Tax=Ictidomys tridecemlineatus TaxID=43179 RepID=UPI000B53DBE8|nr:HIG1 domain family member 2A, mitochondrial isoform X2 [Ictidomys tridecemlineatus]KAG3265725.1 HIG1 hypoxia inducible domain family member 2A, transcript variant X2 [Ictidomys tridecemlineatus]